MVWKSDTNMYLYCFSCLCFLHNIGPNGAYNTSCCRNYWEMSTTGVLGPSATLHPTYQDIGVRCYRNFVLAAAQRRLVFLFLQRSLFSTCWLSTKRNTTKNWENRIFEFWNMILWCCLSNVDKERSRQVVIPYQRPVVDWDNSISGTAAILFFIPSQKPLNRYLPRL